MARAFEPRHAAHFPPGTKNVLVVASTMLDAQATGAQLAALHAREPVRIHLLAIESPLTGNARSHLAHVDVRGLRRAEALSMLAPLQAALDAAGTPYRTHIASGPWLETIARYARDVDCSTVIVGDNERDLFSHLLLRHDRWRIAARLRSLKRERATLKLARPQ